jgi:ArsR family transcriptional regulator
MSQARHFADVADRNDRLRTEEGVAPLVEALVREGALASRRVLEIGCGTGRILELIGKEAAARSGVDPSPEMIEVARRKLGADVDCEARRVDDMEFEAGVERAARELPVRVQTSLDWTIIVGER